MKHEIFDEHGNLSYVVNDGKPEREPPVRSSERVVPRPWPKEGDRVLHEATGKEGDVLSNENGIVRVDWGLYITPVRASELVFVQ